MLYRKKIEPCCTYCRHGQDISPDEMICVKRGVVKSDGHCRLFSYDALKREPAHPVLLDAGRYKPEDFSL